MTGYKTVNIMIAREAIVYQLIIEKVLNYFVLCIPSSTKWSIINKLSMPSIIA